MSEKPTCPVCGGLDYFEEGGFYYCSECQTQSQEIREEVHEFNCMNVGLSKSANFIQQKRKRKKEDDDNEWTSWELHNFVLKGLVDELIALGATEKLKIVVLQLWATYLQKLEVAFTSNLNSYKLPKLGLGFHERDARLLYGIDTKHKRKMKKKNIKSEDVSVASVSDITDTTSLHGKLWKSDYHKSKRALFKAEYEKSCDNMEVDAFNLLNESMMSCDDSSSTVTGTKVKRSYLSKAAVKIGSHKNKKPRNFVNTHPENLSRSILIAILYIGLRMCEDRIQLSDIIRWIEGGELSYYEVSHFLPDAQKLKGFENLIFGQFNNRVCYSGLSGNIKDVIKFLNITHIPSPDMAFLIRRYIEELQLPVEMVDLAERLMCLSLQSCTRTKKELIQNYEGQAMGSIIVTLKLLLGLDGETEYKISEVAEELNRLLDNSAKLFVWTDWMKYIECRKSVLAHFHFPTQNALYQDTFKDPSAYIDFWVKAKSKDPKRKDRLLLSEDRKTDPELREAMSTILQKLQRVDENRIKFPEFVTSFTPQKTNLDTLLESKLEDFESCTVADSILKQDFTRTSLKYLIEPKPYVALAKNKGVKITIEKNSAQLNIEVVKNVRCRHFHKTVKAYKIKDNSEDESLKELPLESENVLFKFNKEKNVKPIKSKRKTSHKNDPFKSLHKLTKSMLLHHLKQNNIELESFVNEKTKTSVPESSEYINSAESSPATSRKENNHSEPNISSVQQTRNPETYENENESNFTLYLSNSDYWIYDARNLPNEDFEMKAMTKFPFSFQWLLKECARILHMSVQELFAEVLNIELMDFHSVNELIKKKKKKKNKQSL